MGKVIDTTGRKIADTLGAVPVPKPRVEASVEKRLAVRQQPRQAFPY